MHFTPGFFPPVFPIEMNWKLHKHIPDPRNTTIKKIYL